MNRRTKIIATLGPSTDDPSTLEALIQAGLDCVRLNFSHGTAAEHEKRVNLVKKYAEELKTQVTILADLQGPKIRIGGFKEGEISLKKGNSFKLIVTEDPMQGSKDQVAIIGYPTFHKEVQLGQILVLDDGHLMLTIHSIDDNAMHCTVMNDGILRSNKGINVQGGGLAAPAFTEKDREDLATALALKVDYVALSFVKTAEDIHALRQAIDQANNTSQIIAKIERAEAMAHLEAIIEAADGIMIARGDLAIEVGEAEVPALQKQALYEATSQAKISIVATQMMESMVDNPHPTRAEISDVANAVLDGTDAVMLSAETAIGQYPVQVIQAVHKACVSVEKYPYLSDKRTLFKKKMSQVDEAVAMASVYTANRLGIRAIITLTESGTTPRWMSRIYTGVPIYALSRDLATLRRSNLYRNVYPLYFDVTQDPYLLYEHITDLLKKHAIVTQQDLVIITQGAHLGIAGKTNTLKIVAIT